MSRIWKNCLSLLKKEVPDSQSISLLLSLKHEEKQNRLRLLAPNEWAFDKIKKNLTTDIRNCLNRTGGENLVVSIELANDQTGNGAASNRKSSAASPSFGYVKSEFSFDNFVSGPSNQVAYQACKNISSSRQLGKELLINGEVGLGKTHLLHAVANVGRAQHKKVACLHSELFTSQVVHGFKNKTIDDFVRQLRGHDCLLLDDFQFFIGKRSVMEVVFHTIDHFLMNNKLLIVVCDKHPKNLGDIEQRLLSRLCGFLPVTITRPDFETRIKILKKKMKSLRLKLKTQDVEFIAETITTNVRELEGALKRIASLVHYCNKKPDIETVRIAIADYIQIHNIPIDIEAVVDKTTDYFSVSLDQICSNSRVRKVVYARHIAMYLCKKLTQESITCIGKYFGDRDHSTVRYSCRKILEKLPSTPQLQQNIQSIENSLKP